MNKLEDEKGKWHIKIENALQNNKLFCMDLEFHEERKYLTEVGISILNPDGSIENYHFIVKETEDLRNGKYVPDHKDNFLFGKSQVMMLDDIEIEVLKLVKDADFLVGHAFKNDRAFLAQCGFLKEINVLDTISYSKFISAQQMSLERMLKTFNIEHAYLHNAGNDAVYTLKLLQTLKEFK